MGTMFHGGIGLSSRPGGEESGSLQPQRPRWESGSFKAVRCSLSVGKRSSGQGLKISRSPDLFDELSPLCHSKRALRHRKGREESRNPRERERERERASSRLAASTTRIQNGRTVSHPLSFGGYPTVVPRKFWVATIPSVCRY